MAGTRSAGRENLLKLTAQPLDDAIPVAERRLPKQSRRGVPAATLTRKCPAPIRRERDKDPDRTPHCTRKMRDRGIDGDDEIDEGNHGGCIGKVVELAADLRDARFAREQLGISVAQIALNTDESDRGG